MTRVVVSSGSQFAEGDAILIGGQRVTVQRVDGDTLTVRPSWWHRLLAWLRLRAAVLRLRFRGAL